MTTLAPNRPTERWERLRHWGTDRTRRLPGEIGHLLRRHWALVLLLLAGVVLRLLVVIAYNPALWYQGDSQSYLGLAYLKEPGTIRPYGYSFFLSLLLDLHSVRRIILIQHLMGLAVVIAGYVFLQRRGVSRLVATLAVAPLLLDARTAALEHFLLAETLFTSLVVLGMLALTWRQVPGWLGVLVAAGAFSWAATTRSIGMVAAVVPVLYLLLRRVDWRKTGAFVAILVITLGGYVVWYHGHHGQYSFGTYGSRFLWARTMTFVDCDKLDLTDEERLTCPDQPIDKRLPPDMYLWGPGSKAEFKTMPDEVFGSFAKKAILGQPLDYLQLVAKETWQTVRPGPYPDDRVACIASVWDFPKMDDTGCAPHMAPQNPAKRRFAGLARDHEHALMNPLNRYSAVATVPATLVGLCFLLAVVLAFYRPRASSWRDYLNPLAWVTLAFGMIIGSVATSMIDPRYTVPSLPLGVIGAALAWQRFRAARQAPDPATPQPSVPSQSSGAPETSTAAASAETTVSATGSEPPTDVPAR
ncbi:hypothetical protein BDK92_6516 [Micromonospora pisi]|uniref:Dolichyl-phosphate-mannose-protein mannosyltransferase n=1 Tax=Micromonospora pisi TaxID=589240 RepID=A0A495JUP6_9ACTN|nr:hypothetical protein [Micromonospora pisi]RKR92084.1 hypothetical protein BDK92_6516 [Micromonospora pisi]